MGVGELYGKAVNSSNLRERPTMGDVDRLKAAALADRALGATLLRMHDGGDLRGARGVIDDLIDRLRRNRGLDAVKARYVAERALAHFLLPTCQECHGRKFQLLTDGNGGRGVLSDARCHSCGGTGEAPLEARHGLLRLTLDTRQFLVNLADNARRHMRALLR